MVEIEISWPIRGGSTPDSQPKTVAAHQTDIAGSATLNSVRYTLQWRTRAEAMRPFAATVAMAGAGHTAGMQATSNAV